MKNFICFLFLILLSTNTFGATLTVQTSLWSDDGSTKGVSTTPLQADDAVVDDSSALNNVFFSLSAGIPLAIKRTIYKSDNTVAVTDRNKPGLTFGNLKLSPAATCALVSSANSLIDYDVCNAEFGTAGFSAARVELQFFGKTDMVQHLILQRTTTNTLFKGRLQATGSGGWKMVIPFSVAP